MLIPTHVKVSVIWWFWWILPQAISRDLIFWQIYNIHLVAITFHLFPMPRFPKVCPRHEAKFNDIWSHERWWTSRRVVKHHISYVPTSTPLCIKLYRSRSGQSGPFIGMASKAVTATTIQIQVLNVCQNDETRGRGAWEWPEAVDGRVKAWPKEVLHSCVNVATSKDFSKSKRLWLLCTYICAITTWKKK